MYGGQPVYASAPRPMGAPTAPGWMPGVAPQASPMVGPGVTGHSTPEKHHRHHHYRGHRRSPDKKSKGGIWSCFENPTRGKRTARVRMMERTGMAVEIDSADEDDWDVPTVNNKVWGDRRGPLRDRPVDDLMITLQDLLPCCAPLFESCGCVKRKPRRMMPAKVPDKNIGGPKLETVCLDCGHVIDTKNIPRTVALDMFDRHSGLHHQAFTHGVAIGEQDPPQTQGIWQNYENWTVAGPHSARDGRTDYIPLPQFAQAPARTFMNSPLDDTVHPTAEMPQF